MLPAGTITETIIISKPLHLKGQGMNQTHLAPTSPANGYALHINAPNVTISDLTIINHAAGLYTTALKISGPNSTIASCRLTNTPIGIAIWSSHTTILNCEFTACEDEGIVLLGSTTSPCTNTTIRSSIFTDNCDGIELQHATQTYISHCSFMRNTHAGIDAIESDNNHNTITHCTFTDNHAYGLYLSRSTQNLITYCTFSDDTLTCIQSPDNTIYQSQGAQIHLLKDSSLNIQQCAGIDQSDIISQQSSYEITPGQSTQHDTRITTHGGLGLRLIQTILTWFRTILVHIQTLRHPGM
jgi:parallel beta-helix repeat protein